MISIRNNLYIDAVEILTVNKLDLMLTRCNNSNMGAINRPYHPWKFSYAEKICSMKSEDNEQ